MPLVQNPHQTVTRFGGLGFSMYVCGFSVPQMRQLGPRLKGNWSEEMIFFRWSTYSFGGRIKLIICHIRHELSFSIHEISTSWKKTLDGEPINFRILFWCLTWGWNPGFSSNKPTHYLLDHGDFLKRIEKIKGYEKMWLYDLRMMWSNQLPVKSSSMPEIYF